MIFYLCLPYMAKIDLKHNEFKADEAKNMLEYVFDSAKSESVIRNNIWLSYSVKTIQCKNVWAEVRKQSYIKLQLGDRGNQYVSIEGISLDHFSATRHPGMASAPESRSCHALFN